MTPSPSEPPNARPATEPFSAAVAEWREPLTRYATRILGDRDQARDVVQDTFLRLHESGHEVPRAALERWLFRVCRNRALDVLRRERRAVGLEAAGDLSVEPSGERARTLVELGELLDDLPDDKREVMALRYRDGHSYRQISEQTGLTVSHVGTILHQATKTLKGRVAIGAALLVLVLLGAWWRQPEPQLALHALPTILERATGQAPPTPLELDRDERVVESPESPEPDDSATPEPRRPSPPDTKFGFERDAPAPD